MPYLVLNIPNNEHKDELLAALSELGFESFWEQEEKVQCFVQEQHYNPDTVQALLHPFNLVASVTPYDEVNWNQTWEDNFTHFEVSDDIIIRIPEFNPEHIYTHEIIIDPDMTFGTGHHPTTRMVLKELHEMESLAGKTVLDCGCGSGILGIMAWRLNSLEVHGYDIDSRSVQNSENNASLNKAKIHFLEGTIQELKECLKPSYDLVLANINLNILEDDMEFYAQKLKENSYLVLSGFYENDVPKLERLLSQLGLRVIKIATEEDWACVIVERKV
jgi:ribosomal protein L11 methyltransferase